MIEHYDPDFFAIGIEVNTLLTKNQGKWEEYKELHKHTYTELKKKYPKLPIFASFSAGHLEGIESGSNASVHQREIRELLSYTDIIAVSIYPYGWSYPGGALKPVPDSFFDSALQFGKQVAVAETGMQSRNFDAFGSSYQLSENDQKQYISTLLSSAQRHNFAFVVNWSTIDYDKLLPSFPAGFIRDFGTFFAYTGLRTSDGRDKPALRVWDEYLQLKR